MGLIYVLCRRTPTEDGLLFPASTLYLKTSLTPLPPPLVPIHLMGMLNPFISTVLQATEGWDSRIEGCGGTLTDSTDNHCNKCQVRKVGGKQLFSKCQPSLPLPASSSNLLLEEPSEWKPLEGASADLESFILLTLLTALSFTATHFGVCDHFKTWLHPIKLIYIRMGELGQWYCIIAANVTVWGEHRAQSYCRGCSKT